MFSYLKTIIYLTLLMPSLYGALTLNECYSLAIANSETMSLADLKALIEEDKTREIWGTALPQLSAQADFITKGDAKHFHHHDRTKNARVSLLVPLYNYGSYSSISAQEKKEEAALIDIDRARQNVLLATSQAYFLLLESQKIEMILRESIQGLKGQLKITNDFKDQGLVHENELLLVEVELSLLEQELLQAQNQVALAIAKLNRLIGYEMDYPTEISDVLEDTQWNGNFVQILYEAKANHPILRSLSAQIEAACYAYKAEKGKLYPAFYGYTNYSTTDDYALPYKHGLDAGIGIQLSLYDGGTTWAKIKRLKKEICEWEQRYSAEEKNIELNIRSAFLNVESAANKLPIASKSIDLAKRSLKLTQDHYAEGLITNLEVINDQEKIIRALYNYYHALYQFHLAKTDLAYAAGMITYTQGCINHEE